MCRPEVSISPLLDVIIKSVLDSGKTLVLDGSIADTVGHLVSATSVETKGPFDLLHEVRASRIGPLKLLDFGCGTGSHRQAIESIGYHYSGVTFVDGMAVGARQGIAELSNVTCYNGLDLPYLDGDFDVVFSHQCFEHCTDFNYNLREINRVLCSDGYLVGSVSYLEQMHDFSAFNFTPFGIVSAALSAGLRVERLYPSYDVFTWMLRRLVITTQGSDENSLTNSLRTDNNISIYMKEYCRKMNASVTDSNLFRLMFSAHITFVMRKAS